MKQITESQFEEILNGKNTCKILVTSPTCDICHNYVDTHPIGEYCEFEGESEVVNDTISRMGVYKVPVFYEYSNGEEKVYEPEDLEA